MARPHTRDFTCTYPPPPRRGSIWSNGGFGTDGKAIRRGVFHSVNDLITAIEDYLKVNNNPKPFVWTATAEQILAKVACGRVALQQV